MKELLNEIKNRFDEDFKKLDDKISDTEYDIDILEGDINEKENELEEIFPFSDLDDLLYDKTPTEIIELALDSNICSCTDWVRYDGYGDLEDADDLRDELKDDIEQLKYELEEKQETLAYLEDEKEALENDFEEFQEFEENFKDVKRLFLASVLKLNRLSAYSLGNEFTFNELIKELQKEFKSYIESDGELELEPIEDEGLEDLEEE